MAIVTVTLRSDSGQSTQSQAEVSTPNVGARGGKAAGVALGGLAFAAASAIVPGPHLAITIPGGIAAGLIGAWVVFNIKASLQSFEATCPACGADTRFEGGKLTERMQEPCPECNQPVRLVAALPDSP